METTDEDLQAPYPEPSTRRGGRVTPHTLTDRLAVVVHELRSPLAVIGMAIASARSGALDGSRRDELLLVVERQAGIALALLDRLSTEDPGAGREAATRRSDFDLGQATWELMADLLPTLATTGSVAFHAPAPVTVHADRLSIAEITTNLLTNAVRHTTDETAIEITVVADDQDAVLIVLDHGPGVAPCDRQRIFDRHITLGASSDGHGLGLFIARQLAHDNGGELTVDDAPGGGARFTLRLPQAP